MRRYTNLYKLLFGTVAILAVILIVPVKVPYKIHTHGRISPVQEWILSKDQAGRLSATLFDRLDYRTSNFGVTQFERQDAIRFLLHERIKPGNAVESGDTVGHIYSHHLEREIVKLEGELKLARANFHLYAAGEKEAVVKEARQRLAYNRQLVEGYTPTYRRARSLYERGLISDAEFETIENQMRLYELDIAIAESQVETAVTGVRDEQLAYIRTQIEVMEADLRSLYRQRDDFILRSPIAGTILHSFSPDTLVRIGDSSGYALLITIPLDQRTYIEPGTGVSFRLSRNRGDVSAEIHTIGSTVYRFNGSQMVIATAALNGTDALYLPGLVVPCAIETPRVTVREYLRRQFGLLL